MKNLSTPSAILLNSAIFAIVSLLAMLAVNIIHDIKLIHILLAAVFIFLIFYFVNKSSIHRLELGKILPLYKLIHKTNISETQLKKELLSKDPISSFKKDFDVWASERSTELKQLTEQEKFRKEFIGNVAHELKTPLFNIQGYIYTLLDGGLEDKSINRKYLERTDKSIDRLISIVKDLDIITRLETGELEFEMEDFDIIAIVEEVFEMQEIRANKKKISLSFVNKPYQPILVSANKKAILQVLTNLIVNAINYGKEYGFVHIGFSVFENYIIVEVSDNGIGIEEKEIPRIFERFYRTDKSRSREQGGTGLGLSIVKHILESHNLTINVRSQLNKGTSIAFTLNKASQ